MDTGRDSGGFSGRKKDLRSEVPGPVVWICSYLSACGCAHDGRLRRGTLPSGLSGTSTEIQPEKWTRRERRRIHIEDIPRGGKGGRHLRRSGGGREGLFQPVV